MSRDMVTKLIPDNRFVSQNEEEIRTHVQEAMNRLWQLYVDQLLEIDREEW